MWRLDVDTVRCALTQLVSVKLLRVILRRILVFILFVTLGLWIWPQLRKGPSTSIVHRAERIVVAEPMIVGDDRGPRERILL